MELLELQHYYFIGDKAVKATVTTLPARATNIWAHVSCEAPGEEFIIGALSLEAGRGDEAN
jgi:hypothetical protein